MENNLIKAALRGYSNTNKNSVFSIKENDIRDQQDDKNQQKEVRRLLGMESNFDHKNLRQDQLEILNNLVQLILNTNLEVREEEKRNLKSQLHNLIEEIIQQRKPEVSLEIFSEALKIVQDAEVYNARSKIHKTLEQYKEALKDFKLAAINGYKYDNQDCQFIENIRLELRDKNLLNKEEMILYLDQLISIIPNSSILYAARGNIYRDQQETKKAIADFDQALKISPNETWRNYEKANIVAESFHLEEALKFYKREREIQSSVDNKNQNLLAWKDATVGALSILVELSKKDEALLMIEELKNYEAKNHDEKLEKEINSFLIHISEIDKINHFKKINPKYVKTIKEIYAINVLRENELDFFKRAKIDDELIELSNKIGDKAAAEEYTERANIDFAKITPDQEVIDKVNKIIYDAYKENQVSKARRWCKRTDFLLTQSEREKLNKIENIKQKVLTKEDLSKEDFKQLIDVVFSDNHVARLEQPIFELYQIDSKYNNFFKALLTQVEFKLGTDKSANKILDEIKDFLKENKNSTQEKDFVINEIKEVKSNISYSNYYDMYFKAKEKFTEHAPFLILMTFMGCLMKCMYDDINEYDGEKELKEFIHKSIKNNSGTQLSDQAMEKITCSMFNAMPSIISNLEKEQNTDSLFESFKEEIKKIINQSCEDIEAGYFFDYDKISENIIKEYAPNTDVKNTKKNNRLPLSEHNAKIKIV